jgi:hypothetical protein
MSAEAVLHPLEFFYALNALGLALRVNEAGERFPELRTTWAVSHPTKAGAIPVDLACDRVICAARGSVPLLSLTLALDDRWCRFATLFAGLGNEF